MTDLRTAAQQALEALEGKRFTACGWRADCDKAITALRAALAEPVLQTCNCRWDGEMQMQQCTLHEAHVDAIKEWAQRAKFAEKKLAALAEQRLTDMEQKMERSIESLKAALAEPVQEPVAGRAFLERILAAMEGVIDVADRKTNEFDALRSCVIDLTLMLHTAPPQRTAEPEGGGNLPPPLQKPGDFDHGIGADRFKVVRGAFWWHVLIGDSPTEHGKFHSRASAEKMAADLLREFRNGAFVQYEAALAEQVEPVAWMVYTLDGKSVCVTDNPADFTEQHKALPLYAAPPRRKPLTEEEIIDLWAGVSDPESSDISMIDFARAIERAQGIT